MSAQQFLDRDSVQFAVFEKIQRCGADRANGQTIFHRGVEYGITANRVCKLETTHVVIECLDAVMLGHQQAMAVLDVYNHGYQGMDGASLMLPALLSGAAVSEPGPGSFKRTWRVLPVIEVPHVFAPRDDTQTD